MRELEGRVAIVTGASSRGGIGWQTVRTLCEHGARVGAVDVDGSGIEQAADELVADGLSVVGIVADISNEDDVIALVASTMKSFGTVDVLDNNAAATSITPHDREVLHASPDVWDATFAVNVGGAMLMCKHILPVMISRGRGSIVNIMSEVALAGDITTPAYAASKAALGSLTRHVATTYGGRGIRCNAIAPGLIETPKAIKAMPSAIRDLVADACLVPRLGRAVDIAETVAFLASDRAAYITGQTLSVDGGLLAHLPFTSAMQKAINTIEEVTL